MIHSKFGVVQSTAISTTLIEHCVQDLVLSWHRLVGLVVRASASREQGPVFESLLTVWEFYGSTHTTDLNTGTPVATLSGARRYRVSTGTGWPDVSIL